MLAAELYELQNLMDDRGVPLDIIRGYAHSVPHPPCNLREHTLHAMLPWREYVSAESRKREMLNWGHDHRWRSGDEAFPENFRALEANQIVEWTVYSANGKPPANDIYGYTRPQRPMGVLRDGRQVLSTPESRPAFMATLLLRLALAGGHVTETPAQLITDWRNDSPINAVESNLVSHVEGVSILRMSERAATENAKVWYRELCQECDRTCEFIAAAAKRYFPQAAELFTRVGKAKNMWDVVAQIREGSSTDDLLSADVEADSEFLLG
jgi:hypothetical protein